MRFCIKHYTELKHKVMERIGKRSQEKCGIEKLNYIHAFNIFLLLKNDFLFVSLKDI